ncbi:ABC transporter substrate-binding protein [Phenylobacterium sp. LjRoot225]|uniref:ABC transporter substrate-binding protein n=1 Tax=Phenylobacterium sp. LjRoot225 TaxID=3342285 RepID=UPI003ED12612
MTSSNHLQGSADHPDRRQALGWVMALAALGAAGPGCARKSTAKASQVLKVGDQRGAQHALLTAAGVLNDVPYEIQWIQMPAAAPLLEALSAGAIDLGGVGGAPFAFAYASGAPIKAVLATRLRTVTAGLGRSSAIIVRPDSPLRTVADLRGRKLATIKGSAGHDIALRILEKAKIDPKSVHFVFLNNGDAKAALASGDIDAWSTWGSYVGIAVEEDGDRILATAEGVIVPGAVAGFQAASDAAVADKAPLLRDFLGRLARAHAWVKTHPDAYAAQIAKETGVPLAVARYNVSYALTTDYTPIDAELIEEQRRTLERYHAAGVIDVMPPVTAASYLNTFSDVVPRPAQPTAAG